MGHVEPLKYTLKRKMVLWHKRIIILFFSFSIGVAKLSAQEEPCTIPNDLENLQAIVTTNSENINSSDSISFAWHDPITKLPKDFYSFGERVFNVNNVGTLVGLTALTGVLVLIDPQTAPIFEKNYKSSPFVHDLSKKTSFIGGGEFHLIMAAAFGSAGLIFNSPRAERTALQIIEAELATGITVQLLKHISGRESPQFSLASRGIFRPFPSINEYHHNETKFYSFPSGHVSTSMAVLTVIADNYPDMKWIKPVGYSVIGLIGVSLVSRGWHWFSDYPLAIAIGYAFGKVITSGNISQTSNDQENSQLLLQPAYINGPGIGLTYRF